MPRPTSPCSSSTFASPSTFPLEHPRLPTLPPAAGGAAPFETRKIYSMLAQEAVEHRVFQRERLRAGHRIDGPAAVEEDGTTTIIDAGDALTVEPHGCLVIEVARAA